jgi:hypothetical protein
MCIFKTKMDGVLANFIPTRVASSLGVCVAIIGGVYSCMLKGRCTRIDSPCISCDREVLDGDNPVYNTPPIPTTVNRL